MPPKVTDTQPAADQTHAVEEETARAARENAVAEWRKHDAAVQEAEAKLRQAEKAREDAWIAFLQNSADQSAG